MIERLLAALLLAVLASLASGQYEPGDPRFEEDPRTQADPRNTKDIRDVEAREAAVARGDAGVLETHELFDALWEQGRGDELSRAMQERPWEVLPYLNRHATVWQLLARRGEAGLPEAQRQAESLRALAELADQGIVDSHFSGWVDSLLAWGPEQHAAAQEARALMGEAGQLLRVAVADTEMLAALTPLQQAAERNRALGDTPAVARTLLSVANVQATNAMRVDARVTLGEAVRLARLVRDLDTTWSGVSMIYETAVLDQEFDVAREALHEQYQLALEVGDEQVSQQVLTRLVNLDNFIAGEPTTTWAPRGRTGLRRPGLGNRN